jgi:hypothetical protein
LLEAMLELACGILMGHVRPSVMEIVEDGIRLALGAGRRVRLQLMSPKRPEWLP